MYQAQSISTLNMKIFKESFKNSMGEAREGQAEVREHLEPEHMQAAAAESLSLLRSVKGLEWDRVMGLYSNWTAH